MTQIINSTVLRTHLLLQEVHPTAHLSKLTQPIVPSWLIYHQVNTELPPRPVLLYGQEETQAWVPWQLHTLPRPGPVLALEGSTGRKFSPQGAHTVLSLSPHPNCPTQGWPGRIRCRCLLSPTEDEPRTQGRTGCTDKTWSEASLHPQ